MRQEIRIIIEEYGNSFHWAIYAENNLSWGQGAEKSFAVAVIEANRTLMRKMGAHIESMHYEKGVLP